jgi:hypothetical protein
MKNYKVTTDTDIITVKADKFVIEHFGTLVFYVDKSKINGKNDWQRVCAFNGQKWVEVLLEVE